MTIDELRDRLAELCGYTWHKWTGPDLDGTGHWYGPHGVFIGDHPFEDGDYNALIAAWPEGWRLSTLQLMDGSWWAAGCPVGGVDVIEVDEVPTRYEAELRLTVAVLEDAKPSWPLS